MTTGKRNTNDKIAISKSVSQEIGKVSTIASISSKAPACRSFIRSSLVFPDRLVCVGPELLLELECQ